MGPWLPGIAIIVLRPIRCGVMSSPHKEILKGFVPESLHGPVVVETTWGSCRDSPGLT